MTLPKVRAEQMERSHGVDPAVPVPLPIGDVPTVAPKTKRGHARQAWQNVQIAVYMDIHSKERAIPKDEMDRLYASLDTKWREMSDEERNQWEFVHESEVQARFLQKEPEEDPQPPPTDEPSLGPLWGSRDGVDPSRQPPVDPELIIEEHNKTNAKERRKLARHDECLILSTAEPRASTYTYPEDGSQLLGCYVRKKRCRRVIDPVLLQRFETLVSRFNRWITSLGVIVSRNAENLLLLRGLNRVAIGPVHQIEMCVLVLHCRSSPKVNILAGCMLKHRPEAGLQFVLQPDEFPITFRPAIRNHCSATCFARCAFSLTRTRVILWSGWLGIGAYTRCVGRWAPTH